MTEEQLLKLELEQMAFDDASDFEKAPPVAIAPTVAGVSELIVGARYAVPCVFYSQFPHVPIPVIGSLHNDGRDWLICGGEHFHTDYRFISPRYLQMYIDKAGNDCINFTANINDLMSTEAVVLDRVLFREHPGAVKAIAGPSFIRRHIGKSAQWDVKSQCFRCPHQQTPLQNAPSADGTFTCPAHFLIFNKDRVCIGDKERKA